MISFQLGRPPATRTVNIRPGWLLAPAGLAASLLIGLVVGYFQSPMLVLLMAGAGMALVWVLGVALRPEWALLIYAVLAVNLNGVDLPLSFAGLRVSPDIVLMVLLIAGTALRLLHTRQALGKLQITAPYLVFLAVAFATIIWSPVPLQSVKGAFRFVGYYALMWLIVDSIRTKRQALRLLTAIMLSPIIPILVALEQVATGGGQVIWAGAVYNRVYALAGGPFTLAYYLVLVIPLLFVFFMEGRKAHTDEDTVFPLSRPLLAAILAGSLVVLLLTFIRGSWLALSLAMGLLGVLRYRYLLVALPAAMTAVLLAYAPAQSRLQQTLDPTSTLFGRLRLWQFAIEWIRTNPLAGVGMKAFEYYHVLLPAPYSGAGLPLRVKFLIGKRPHNELLGFLLDVGIIGTVALIVALVILARLAIRILRFGPTALLRATGLAFIASAAGMLVGSLGDNVFSQPSVATYFWLLAGIVMAIDRYMMDGSDVAQVAAND